MKIITRIEFQMTDEGMEEIFRDDFHYEGALELAGGGPSKAQEAAATSQTNINNQLATVAGKNEAYTEAQRDKTTPFYTNLMNNGPDYYNAATDSASGVNAKAFAPARANLIRSLGPSSGLPGYRDQALSDFDEKQAQSFDGQLMALMNDRQLARERGAAGIMGEAQQANPLGYYQGASQGNSSIMNAPLRKPGVAGLVGGLVSGGLNAATAFA